MILTWVWSTKTHRSIIGPYYRPTCLLREIIHDQKQ